MPIILKNVSYTYQINTPFMRKALRDINLHLGNHEILGILGGTGSGKTTLLQIITGLLTPDSGQIVIDEADIKHYRKKTVNIFDKIGIVFQVPEEQIFEKSVFAEVAFGLQKKKLSPAEISRRVESALLSVGLSEDYYQRFTYSLSSGEKRRLAIASVLVLETEYIFFDEPTAGLDYEGRTLLLDNIKKLNEEKRIGMIIVSHDPLELFNVCHKCVFLKDGQLIFSGDLQAWRDNYEFLTGQGMVFPKSQQLVCELKRRGWDLKGEMKNFEEVAARIINCYDDISN
ncbi:MAG: energy-coupling factor ABC transporter ATP-binding protein [Syntrophomonadaceae bacterium]|jgi:energy-coupling factor transport system ATP-binding protein|nr:energy-coupling factor ABC transporter ATP-binding protein [Syntrophomonadaceae bacterium]